MSEALILASTNPQYDNKLFIELPVQYLHENYKLRTCCVHKLFWISKQKQKTICVHNMFWAWNFHVLNWWFNGQSVVILWVGWCKNKRSDNHLPVSVSTCLNMKEVKKIAQKGCFVIKHCYEKHQLFVNVCFAKGIEKTSFRLRRRSNLYVRNENVVFLVNQRARQNWIVRRCQWYIIIINFVFLCLSFAI